MMLVKQLHVALYGWNEDLHSYGISNALILKLVETPLVRFQNLFLGFTCV